MPGCPSSLTVTRVFYGTRLDAAHFVCMAKAMGGEVNRELTRSTGTGVMRIAITFMDECSRTIFADLVETSKLGSAPLLSASSTSVQGAARAACTHSQELKVTRCFIGTPNDVTNFICVAKAMGGEVVRKEIQPIDRGGMQISVAFMDEGSRRTFSDFVKTLKFGFAPESCAHAA